MKFIPLVLIGLLVGASVGSCNVDGWGKSGNYDTLFLGFSLGMGKQAFYDYCWQMNKEKMITHGPTNQMVQYKLVGELEQPVFMRFYPYFYKDRISEMDVTFEYEGWAPWNKQYSADTLLPRMVKVFEKWYGPGFKTTETKRRGTVYYKTDGHRRITIFRKDEQYVEALLTDVRDERKWKEEMNLTGD